MKISILTNLHERCGIYRYAQDLHAELSKYFDCNLVDVLTASPIFGKERILIINYSPGRMPHLKPADLCTYKRSGVRVLFILHESLGSSFVPAFDIGLLAESDAAVAHEPVPGCFFIPHGIPEVLSLPEPNKEFTVGTAGFAFPWKNFEAVVSVAEKLGCRANFIVPPHESMDFSGFVQNCRQRLGDRLEIETSWLPIEEAVKRLAHSTVNIFFYQSYELGAQIGQSGAARMGVAARRPMIISTHRKLNTIRAFEDEFYVAHTTTDVELLVGNVFALLRAGKPVRRPQRIMEEQGWSVVGRIYRDLIFRLSETTGRLVP